MPRLLKHDEQLGCSLAEARSWVTGHDVDMVWKLVYWHVTSNTGAGALNSQ